MNGTFDRLAGASWRMLVIAGAVGLGALVVNHLQLVVLPLALAVVLASLLEPLVRWLRHRGWKRSLAAGTVTLAACLVLGGAGAYLVLRLIAEMGELVDSVARAVRQVRGWFERGPLGLAPETARETVDAAVERLKENGFGLVTGAVTGAVYVLELTAGALLTAIAAFFFIKDGDRIVDWTLERVPPERRERVRAAGAGAWMAVTGYIRGMALVALVDAVGIALGLTIIGVPLAVPIAILTFIGGFIPFVGAVTAGLLATLVALVSGGPIDALLAAGVAFAVQQIEGNVLAPLVLSRAVRLHPLVVLFALTAGAVVAGVVGAFFAVPLVAIAAAVEEAIRRSR